MGGEFNYLVEFAVRNERNNSEIVETSSERFHPFSIASFQHFYKSPQNIQLFSSSII